MKTDFPALVFEIRSPTSENWIKIFENLKIFKRLQF